MAKKRGKNLPVQESSETESTCKHIQKGVKEGAVKKALVNVEWNVCQDCHTEGREKASSEDEEGDMVWICLKCGHRGCGRYSEQQHALNHYNTPRSEPHCLVLSVGDWNVWCYLCDNQVDYNSSGPLRQLVEFIQRKAKARSKTSDKGQADEVLCNNGIPQENETPNTSEDPTKSITKVDKTASTPNDGKEMTVKGLSNLGNTCFFNAVMQNLSQTPALRELLNEVKHPGRTVQVQVPDTQPSYREVKLEQQPGPLTSAMLQFLTEMQETKKGVVTPKELFSQVCKKAVRFRGYQQQDSQELLRYLLDGMRGEEIQRVSLALSKTLQDTSAKMDEEEVKKVVKECEKKRVIPNFVDRLFGGELTSTIMCETCCTVSLVHEPFLDLSLPVLDDTPPKKNNPKSFKNISKQKNEEEDDDGGDGGYVKERNDSTSGTSKHLQKKAKKQAKKQAKNQRQQQKLQGKTVQFSDLNANQPEEEEDAISDNNNTLDNNGKPADVSSTEKDETVAEKAEDPSEPDGEACRNNVDGAENLSEGVEDQKDDHEQRSGSPDDPCSSSRNPEENCELSTETPEIKENGVLGEETVENNEDQCENLDMTQSPRAEEDTDHLTESINRLNLSSGLEPSDIEIEIIGNAPSPQVYEVVNEDPKTAFCTLSDRKDLQVDEWSVLGCLSQFTRKESLVGNNQLLCNTCTQRQAKAGKNTKGDKKFVYSNAKKQMLVSLPPPILTLHLKRFQQNGLSLHKLNKHIKFPEVIDLAPFCTNKCKNIRDGECRLLYALYGVIEHSGTMRSGHYTAYVKSRTPNLNLSELVLQGVLPEALNTEPARGHWYHISDSHVQAVPLSKVLNSQAYLLFYERML
ncbi:ubiquitin carboxyl-terminal hydrolase 16 [Dendropsophus ebraccatus]|uniref:ubiquitin carboxyl-terminal hydrolase 16 n=1 Tax=Dendropsophus ebraccatus TaxID=150705 RepID=UPI0038311F88